MQGPPPAASQGSNQQEPDSNQALWYVRTSQAANTCPNLAPLISSLEVNRFVVRGTKTVCPKASEQELKRCLLCAKPRVSPGSRFPNCSSLVFTFSIRETGLSSGKTNPFSSSSLVLKCSREKTFKYPCFAFECHRNWLRKQSLILKIF